MLPDVFGRDFLLAQVRKAPSTPGVYRMLNRGDEVLYVGKAKNLKNRLTSYTQTDQLPNRLQRMVHATTQLILVETPTEAEALLLEANLIKSLHPKYNIRLKDNSSYPSILITAEETPQLRFHRGAKKAKGDYFGPYPNGGSVTKTLDLLERVFRLRTCKPSQFENRTRPCLKYDIKRCSAPCVGRISQQDYGTSVQLAKQFLNGKNNDVQKTLQTHMQTASEAQDYERAMDYRDRLGALQHTTSYSSAMTHALENADVMAIVQNGNRACVQSFFYRNGQHVGNAVAFPTHVNDTPLAEVLQLYCATTLPQRGTPKEVYCNLLPAEHEMLESALTQHIGHPVKFMVPQRGEKVKVVEQALKNAERALAQKLAETDNWSAQITGFAEKLETRETIERIECFDISNISGKHAVASMVVADAEGMNKQQYRKFKIQGKDTPDDYAMLCEAFTRRYTRLLKENPEGMEVGSLLPSVVMTDGGKGQLNVLIQVFEILAQTFELPQEKWPALVGIAKGEFREKGLETIFEHTPNGLREVPVDFNSPLKFVLQRIRDESHRFAITFHRATRAKTIEANPLNDIPGVGAKRKKALLLHFGSHKAIMGASQEELSRADGISPKLAEDIWGWLHA